VEFGDRGGEGYFQPFGEAAQAFLRLLRTKKSGYSSNMGEPEGPFYK
jgi:hypothetical protein